MDTNPYHNEEERKTFNIEDKFKVHVFVVVSVTLEFKKTPGGITITDLVKKTEKYDDYKDKYVKKWDEDILSSTSLINN